MRPASERSFALRTPRRATRAGFTLVETMVAVIVLSVLMAIAIPAWSRIRTSARIREAEAMLELVSAAVAQLAWDTGDWPSGYAKYSSQGRDREVWDLTVNAAGLLGTDGSYTGWQGPYIPDIPKDPWGQDYFFDPDYRIDGVNHFVVGSFGPNRVGPTSYDSDNIYVVLE